MLIENKILHKNIIRMKLNLCYRPLQIIIYLRDNNSLFVFYRAVV
ncbi:hypothetical protein FHW88_001066 [Mucilaginibacter sp. SG538B]|nr:hypothetical protein [Mucilaginibacter sp. SG538B]